MDFLLKGLRPPFLAPAQGESEIWGCELVLPRAALVQVTAPSARGKSTLISMLYGLFGDYTGSLCLGELDLKRCSAARWAELRQQTFSVVFQDLRLFENFSGLDNIMVKAELAGMVSEQEVREMGRELGMAGALDKPVGRMSRGEQQRVAILRALVQPFSWLLLDEPFSHLDNANSQRCTALILAACREREAGLILTSLEPATPLACEKVVRL